MSERDDLVASICATTADYRVVDRKTPNPLRVERWVAQFDYAVQVPILREMDHVLKNTYVNQTFVEEFLSRLIRNEKLTGNDACAFWRSKGILGIQTGGNSQRDMLRILDARLGEECGFGIGDCASDGNAFIYIDDILFTGDRLYQDLSPWIREVAPPKCRVYILLIAYHTYGQYNAAKRLRELSRSAGKQIEFSWWSSGEFEDRKSYTNQSEVLRPTRIPNDPAVEAYVAGMKYPPHLRVPMERKDHNPFSGEEGRQLLESEFLKAGVRIRQMCPYLQPSKRPLGHMGLETLGFGSTIVSYRNCPNNAPLALWVDDPWVPLFPRSTNANAALRNEIDALLGRKP